MGQSSKNVESYDKDFSIEMIGENWPKNITENFCSLYSTFFALNIPLVFACEKNPLVFACESDEFAVSYCERASVFMTLDLRFIFMQLFFGYYPPKVAFKPCD